MSRIESEARQLLMERKSHLRRGPEVGSPADPTASWRDWESTPPPLPEAARRELTEIDAALRRLEAGMYGRCEACNGPLGLQRIRAIPEARYCLSCSGHAIPPPAEDPA
jgi:RNA polymerase-binding transcription factor DksA